MLKTVAASALAGEWEDATINSVDGIIASQANAAGNVLMITDEGHIDFNPQGNTKTLFENIITDNAVVNIQANSSQIAEGATTGQYFTNQFSTQVNQADVTANDSYYNVINSIADNTDVSTNLTSLVASENQTYKNGTEEVDLVTASLNGITLMPTASGLIDRFYGVSTFTNKTGNGPVNNMASGYFFGELNDGASGNIGL